MAGRREGGARRGRRNGGKKPAPSSRPRTVKLLVFRPEGKPPAVAVPVLNVGIIVRAYKRGRIALAVNTDGGLILISSKPILSAEEQCRAVIRPMLV